MGGPFFSTEGMAFQTNGSDMEAQANIKMAMEKVYDYAFKGGDPAEAQFALAYLEDNVEKISRFCDDLRTTFFLDDFQDSELKRKICVRAYNNIVDRLNGKPIKQRA